MDILTDKRILEQTLGVKKTVDPRKNCFYNSAKTKKIRCQQAIHDGRFKRRADKTRNLHRPRASNPPSYEGKKRIYCLFLGVTVVVHNTGKDFFKDVLTSKSYLCWTFIHTDGQIETLAQALSVTSTLHHMQNHMKKLFI